MYHLSFCNVYCDAVDVWHPRTLMEPWQKTEHPSPQKKNKHTKTKKKKIWASVDVTEKFTRAAHWKQADILFSSIHLHSILVYIERDLDMSYRQSRKWNHEIRDLDTKLTWTRFCWKSQGWVRIKYYWVKKLLKIATMTNCLQVQDLFFLHLFHLSVVFFLKKKNSARPCTFFSWDWRW